MKKKQCYIIILAICSMILLIGCGNKNHSKNNHSSNNHSSNNHSNYTTSNPPTQAPATAALENAPEVNLNNITITAGSEIDYMSAIESVENMDLKKSMVSINSSSVDRFTPGSYTVYYTFDYMGHTVKSFMVVTVLENTEETTAPAETTTKETQTEEISETASSEQSQTSSAETSTEETSNEETSSESNTEFISSEITEEHTDSSNETGALNATIYHPDIPIPDAVFTLSTGEVVTIKNTPERYIVETFTDDSYYTEDGNSYLRSELKVLMNTGEVQTVEMVITRVNTMPEESSTNEI